MSAHRPWKSMLAIATLILGIGVYRQYANAAGVFAADGLVLRVQQTLDRLLEIGSIDEAETLAGEADAPGAALVETGDAAAFLPAGPQHDQIFPIARPAARRSFVQCSPHHCR